MNWRQLVGSFPPRLTIAVASLLGVVLFVGTPRAFVWLVRLFL